MNGQIPVLRGKTIPTAKRRIVTIWEDELTMRYLHELKYIATIAIFALFYIEASADEYTELVSLFLSEKPAPVAVAAAQPKNTGDLLGAVASAMAPRPVTLEGVAEAMAVSSQLKCLDRMMGTEPRPTLGPARRHFLGYAPQTYNGKFFRPVFGGVITSQFGYRPAFKRIHNGIDISLRVGDTVRAALPGVVKTVGYESGGYGNYVVLTHPDGVETRYAHLSRSLVVQGQQVISGDAIALGGNTGNSTGPHLHFEARVLGTPVDPAVMFDFNTPGVSEPSTLMASPMLKDMPALNTIAKKRIESKDLSAKRTYVVKAGDTPATVAARAGISVQTLCRLNMIRAEEPLETGRMIKLK